MHTLRRHRLAFFAALAGLLGLAALASAAISSEGAKPKPSPLPQALHRAFTAPEVEGVTARIEFTNRLVASEALPEGTSSPLLSGAKGRAWVAADGRFRLELQSERGDAQIVSDGRRITLFDAKANKVYTAALPRERKGAARSHRRARRHHGPPTVREIRRGLRRLARHLTVSGAVPTNVAGRPAYSVSAAPRENGGLLGDVSVAWDASKGLLLRAAVTAKGGSEPVLALEATDIDYGPVPASALKAPAAPGAKRERFRLPRHAAHGRHSARRHSRQSARRRALRGVRVARARLGDAFAAPVTLLGRKRHVVRVLTHRGEAPKALVLYGEGLDGLAVLEERDSGRRADGLRDLPSVSIDGAPGRKLPTALGTAVTWREAGARYTLVGSVKDAEAEAAARALR